MRPIAPLVLACAFAAVTGAAAHGAEHVSGPEKRVYEAVSVLNDIGRMPEGGIPEDLIGRCRALAVFPSVYKGGFVLGASFGRGILVARDPESGEWTGPVFLTLGGGSFGWQIGVQATDLILVIMNRRGLDAFLQSNLTLGGDVSVAAGPVGRGAKASTDVTLSAEIYSYSRSKGFFAGLSLEGVYVGHDYRADEAFYGRTLTPMEILGATQEPLPEAAEKLREQLIRCCPGPK